MPARKLRSLRYTQLTLDHGFDAETGLLMEGDIAHAKRLGLGEIGHTGIAAVAGGLAWRLAVAGDVALQHRQKTLSIGRIASLDNDVEDQAAATGRQIDLVTDIAPRGRL